MSRDRCRWRKDAGVLVLFATACAVIAVAQMAEMILRSWGVPLLLAACAGAAGYRLGQRRRAKPPSARVLKGTVVRTPDLSAENAALRDEIDQLRAEVSDARQSAEMAWTSAADRPPGPARTIAPGAVRLVDQPFSGVRRLFPGHGR